MQEASKKVDELETKIEDLQTMVIGAIKTLNQVVDLLVKLEKRVTYLEDLIEKEEKPKLLH
jgi:hypothetical protein